MPTCTDTRRKRRLRSSTRSASSSRLTVKNESNTSSLSKLREHSPKTVRHPFRDRSNSHSCTTHDDFKDLTASNDVTISIKHLEESITTPTTRLFSAKCSLPFLNWASSDALWGIMLDRQAAIELSPAFLSRHSGLQPFMRSITFDWLLDVCEVCKLRRETFYMAQHFFDVYLSESYDVDKSILQLLATTALHVAAKIEEIHPPKLKKLVFYTNGACTIDDVLKLELVLVKQLKWQLSPVTLNTWLTLFFQSACKVALNDSHESHNFVLESKYSTELFARACQILDFCVLDIDCHQFSYNVLAAGVMCHVVPAPLVYEASGLRPCDLCFCIQWVTPFSNIIETNELFNEIPRFRGILPSEYHTIQTNWQAFSYLSHVSHPKTNFKGAIMSEVLMTPQSIKT